jgi:putative membrane protein
VGACFLIFVAVAGIFGAFTVSPRIMVVQTVPAVVGLILLALARRRANAQ